MERKAPSLKQAVKGSKKKSTGTKKPEKLAVNIALAGNKKEKARLTKIVNMLAETKMGKQVLETAASYGYEVDFEEGIGVLGAADESAMLVSLNPESRDDELLGTLAHELRHGCQYEAGISPDIDEDNTKSHIMKSRAMEADAETIACLVSWQMKENGKEGPWKEFKRQAPKMSAAVEKIASGENLDKNGKLKEEALPDFMTAAFKEWYRDDYIRQSYDNTHIDSLKNADLEDGSFSDDMPPKEIITACCELYGNIYLKEKPALLEQKEYLGVAKKTLDEFKKVFRERKEEYGHQPDPTLKEIPILEPKKKSLKDIKKQATGRVVDDIKPSFPKASHIFHKSYLLKKKQKEAGETIKSKRMEKAVSKAASLKAKKARQR